MPGWVNWMYGGINRYTARGFRRQRKQEEEEKGDEKRGWVKVQGPAVCSALTPISTIHGYSSKHTRVAFASCPNLSILLSTCPSFRGSNRRISFPIDPPCYTAVYYCSWRLPVNRCCIGPITHVSTTLVVHIQPPGTKLPPLLVKPRQEGLEQVCRGEKGKTPEGQVVQGN